MEQHDGSQDLNPSPHCPPGLSFAELLGEAVARAIETHGSGAGFLSREGLRAVATDAIREAMKPFRVDWPQGTDTSRVEPEKGVWYWAHRRGRGWFWCMYWGEGRWMGSGTDEVRDVDDWCVPGLTPHPLDGLPELN